MMRLDTRRIDEVVVRRRAKARRAFRTKCVDFGEVNCSKFLGGTTREFISLPGIGRLTYREVGGDDEDFCYVSTMTVISTATTSYTGTDRPLTCRTVSSAAHLKFLLLRISVAWRISPAMVEPAGRQYED